jgi:hypothetical protein
MTNIETFHRQPCATCNHRDMHGEVSGCVHVEGTAWCDCTEYTAPSTGRVIPSRRTDPETSHQAAASVVVTARNQRGRLLAAHATASQYVSYDGLTDEEAMENAQGVAPTSEFAKRCSELRDAGLIVPTGATRKGGAGIPRIVSKITDQGLKVARNLTD